MKKVIIVVLMSVLSFHTFAKDSSSGCGPGWYVAKDNSLLSSALRATTNGLLFPSVTFGMTFGTSNCSKHSIVKLEKERLKFATENYYEIAVESAKGNGEYLTAYGELMGCQSTYAQKFSDKMRENFGHIFSESEVSPEDLVKKTYLIILQDNELRKACFQV